jgi:hypothetical protein
MENFLKQVEEIIKEYERETNNEVAHDKQALMMALEEVVDEYIANN